MSYPDGVPSDICDIIVRTTSANRSKPFLPSQTTSTDT